MKTRRNWMLISSYLLLSAVLFSMCSKQEYEPEIASTSILVGEWTLHAETKYKNGELLESEYFSCSNEECHRLIFTDSSLKIIETHEDYTSTYLINYNLVENGSLSLRGGLGFYAMNEFNVSIQYNDTSRQTLLILSYSNPNQNSSGNRVYLRM